MLIVTMAILVQTINVLVRSIVPRSVGTFPRATMVSSATGTNCAARYRAAVAAHLSAYADRAKLWSVQEVSFAATRLARVWVANSTPNAPTTTIARSNHAIRARICASKQMPIWVRIAMTVTLVR
jgi:hypothetical protein